MANEKATGGMREVVCARGQQVLVGSTIAEGRVIVRVNDAMRGCVTLELTFEEAKKLGAALILDPEIESYRPAMLAMAERLK